MPPTAPCGEPDETRCPYLQWQADADGSRPRGIWVHGRDLRRNPRFKCSVCGHTFGAPSGPRLAFRQYQRFEAFAARSGHKKERPATLAGRLGVHPRTIDRWEVEWQRASADGRPWVLPEGFDYEAGRQSRMKGQENTDQYAVSDVDRERFIKASIGEMRHSFRKRTNPMLDEFDAYAHIALDRSRSTEDRMAALSKCRTAETDEFFDKIFNLIKPAGKKA